MTIIDDLLLEPFDPGGTWPEPGSEAELRSFTELQRSFPALYERVFPHPNEPRTVVVVPSLSLDNETLLKVRGVEHYEQRMLCMLMLLRLPRTRIVYLSSTPVDPTIIDYYLHLLSGVPSEHARRRLTLLSAHDATLDHLTLKVLARPRLVERIRRAIGDPSIAHMACFNVTESERTLAVRLGVPIYGCDPGLGCHGGKSGSREAFRLAGIPLPAGFEGLSGPDEVLDALCDLKGHRPDLRRAVVKLEEGMSGEGNAVYDLSEAPRGHALPRWIRDHVDTRLRFEAQGESWGRFSRKLEQMGGIVEEWIEGATRSPSVQCRIDPLGGIEVISTHDQILGGPSGQVFLGSTFPADPHYRLEIQAAGRSVGEVLRDKGVLGRYGVDFVSVPREGGGWDHSAIEINLRKGGTTHTFMTLQFLTDGHYDESTGTFRTPTDQPRAYYATDNLVKPAYRRLTPVDLIDIAVERGLHFHAASQEGVVFHLIGAIAEYGKLGAICVAPAVEQAEAMFEDTVEILDEASAVTPSASRSS